MALAMLADAAEVLTDRVRGSRTCMTDWLTEDAVTKRVRMWYSNETLKNRCRELSLEWCDESV